MAVADLPIQKEPRAAPTVADKALLRETEEHES